MSEGAAPGTDAPAEALSPELAALSRRFVLREETVQVPGLPTWTLRLPRSAEDLISEEEFARDERLPYWADLWPSALVLAAEVAAHAPATADGADTMTGAARGAAPRAIELGCGLGLPALAALAHGWSVLATDYYDDALRFCRWNALACTGREPMTRMVDWRHWPDDLGTFDLVLAADVLYERPYGPLVAAAVVRSLAPGGVAWLADPGRVAAEGFREACAALGAQVTVRRVVERLGPSGAPQRVTVHEITREG